ncbi:lysozyme inhibitor LprI family protein [Virgibacillus dakarensis]|uniref:lysozyme inhibitor LprI family protein n=1 Tax=Virgibacillus dakarensis TaxID=1917889 RepID=UPI001F398DC1|nr:lysozyme inhibitor LprI family protein [Virgibacillus dakarensis]
MSKSRIFIVASLLVVVLVVFTGCNNSSDTSSSTTSSDSSTAIPKNEDEKQNSVKSDSPDDTDTTDSNDQGDTLKEDEEDVPINNTTVSLKEEYLKKLNDTKKETDEMEAEDTSTYALKKVENDTWDIWDELLNEIYGALKEQLPPEEMDQLREEQRNWIKYRDDSALEASLKYKGGTQEHLEYVTVFANLTEERCFELVEDYM